VIGKKAVSLIVYFITNDDITRMRMSKVFCDASQDCTKCGDQEAAHFTGCDSDLTVSNRLADQVLFGSGVPACCVSATRIPHGVYSAYLNLDINSLLRFLIDMSCLLTLFSMTVISFFSLQLQDILQFYTALTTPACDAMLNFWSHSAIPCPSTFVQFSFVESVNPRGENNV
jgi:hypothetical protein